MKTNLWVCIPCQQIIYESRNDCPNCRRQLKYCEFVSKEAAQELQAELDTYGAKCPEGQHDWSNNLECSKCGELQF